MGRKGIETLVGFFVLLGMAAMVFLALRAANLGELAEVLERVRLIKGIAATETSIHLQTYKLS